MNRRYDDEGIVALLHDAVPAPPEPPDRIAAIRHRAGRQRATLWTQALGAVASVVLVVGVAAAVGGPEDLRPAHDAPLTKLVAAFDGTESHRFELTTELAAPITKPVDLRVFRSVPEAEQRMSMHVVGADSGDGERQLDGDLSLIHTTDEVHMRVADGGMYTSLPQSFSPSELGGKTWVKVSSLNENWGDRQSIEGLVQLAATIATDVHEVRRTTVRGTPVTEYELTLPNRWTRAGDITVTFALDDEDRLRRLSTEFSWQAVQTRFNNGDDDTEEEDYAEQVGQDPDTDFDPLMLRVEYVMWGYGEYIDIKPPPAYRVYDSDVDESSVEWGTRLSLCMQVAGQDREKSRECWDKYARPSPSP